MLENIKKNISSKYNIIPRYNFDFDDFTEIDIVHLHSIATSALKRKILFFKNSKILKYGGLNERLNLMENNRRVQAFKKIKSFLKYFEDIFAFFLIDSKIKKYNQIKERPKFIGGVRGLHFFKKAKPVLKYFDAIHVNNSKLKKYIERYHPNVFLCYAGINKNHFKPIGSKPKVFTICWAGDKTKSLKNFPLLFKFGFPVKFATKENYIPHQKMPHFYNSASVYVNLSSNEGFCRPIVEAAACGLPVVSTNVGVASDLLSSEWVVDGDPRQKRVFLKIKKKIQLLKEDQMLREEVGRKNRESAIRWDWKIVVKQFEEMFEKILQLGDNK